MRNSIREVPESGMEEDLGDKLLCLSTDCNVYKDSVGL